MTPLQYPLQSAGKAAQARFARRIVAHLREESERVDGDIAERLRFAREQALDRARHARSGSQVTGVGVTGAGAALFGSGWGLRIASALPLIALVVGLVVIQQRQAKAQIEVAVEVDAALLADDLPTIAYRDPGFFEFIKNPPPQ